MSTPSQSPARTVLHGLRALPTERPRAWHVGVLGFLALMVAAIYLPYALRGGWYHDDWEFYASMRDAADQSLRGYVAACSEQISGGRATACTYHATVYSLLGEHRELYHVVAMAFLWGMAALTYAILCLARMPRGWAAIAAIALVIYPASDAARLWPVAAVGQYVMVLYLGGLALGLVALDSPGRQRRAIALHAVSLALTLLAVLTYEIVIPLVALNGIVYLVAIRRRPALVRGAADFAIAAGVGLSRLLSPSNDGVFVVERTTEQTIARARLLARRSWDVWHDVFVPGIGGLLALAAVLLAALIVARIVPDSRRRIAPWGAVFVVALGFVGATAIGYVSANDTYVPDVFSTYSRMNLPGSVAAAVAFVAALALVIEVGRGLRIPRLTAVAATVVTIVLAVHMLGLSSNHKRSWEEAWRVQEHALDGYRTALAPVDPRPAIIGFDVPQWEAGWVPVFATSWDLRGALDYETDVDPLRAVPAQEGMVCGPRGVLLGEEPFADYRSDEAPLWFVSPYRKTSERVRSQRQCQALVDRWGYAPAWGRTVTDPAAIDRSDPVASGAASTTSE
jgi:hypothetical protein